MLAVPRHIFKHGNPKLDPENLSTFQIKCLFHLTMIAMEAKKRLRHRGLLLTDASLAAHNRAEDDLETRVPYQRWMPALTYEAFYREGFAITRSSGCRMIRTQVAFTQQSHLLEVMHFLEELRARVHEGVDVKGEKEFTTIQYRRLNLLFVSEMERATDPKDNPPIDYPELKELNGVKMKYDYSRPPAAYRVEKFFSSKTQDVMQPIRVMPEEVTQ